MPAVRQSVQQSVPQPDVRSDLQRPEVWKHPGRFDFQGLRAGNLACVGGLLYGAAV